MIDVSEERERVEEEGETTQGHTFTMYIHVHTCIQMYMCVCVCICLHFPERVKTLLTKGFTIFVLWIDRGNNQNWSCGLQFKVWNLDFTLDSIAQGLYVCMYMECVRICTNKYAKWGMIIVYINLLCVGVSFVVTLYP